MRNLIPLTLLTVLGCADWPPKAMYPPANAPIDARVDPWIGKLLAGDVANAQRVLDSRLRSDLPALSPLVKQMHDFIPVQVAFESGVGYVRCVRRSRDKVTGAIVYDPLYLSEPLSADDLESKVTYFEQRLRPLTKEFFARFAGSGDAIETSGRFTHRQWLDASETFLHRNENGYGTWLDSKVLYTAMNGDSVLVRSDGSTAWHTLETDEITPLAKTFEEFLRIYAAFRETSDAFDSWTCCEHQKDRTKR